MRDDPADRWEPAGASGGAGPRGTVLVVEDQADDALLLRRAISKAHVPRQVHVVADGEAAVGYLTGLGPYADRARHPLPIVVLLDLKLPRKSGLELLAWLRTEPGLRRLPVVVLTSSREAADVNQAYELGANSYLVKPAALGTLVDMVRALDGYWRALSEQPSPEPP